MTDIKKEIIKDFPNKALISLATDIMCDPDCSKLLYYEDVHNEDIYDKPNLSNPIRELKNKKVFINKKIDIDNFDKGIAMYVMVCKYAPYATTRYTTSKYVFEVELEIGIVCADGCRDTLNGQRDVALMSRIVDMFCVNNMEVNYKGIGGHELLAVNPLMLPGDLSGYQIILKIDNSIRKA